MQKLVVNLAFADYQRGDEITDADTVAALLDTHRAYVSPVEIVKSAKTPPADQPVADAP